MADVGRWTPVKGNTLTDVALEAQERADADYYVISGCDVHQTASPSKSVTIDAGVVVWNGTKTTVAGNNIDTTALIDPSNPKIDAVYIDVSGVAQIHDGSAVASTPGGQTNWLKWYTPFVAASVPAGVILSRVRLGAAAATIVDADIEDIAAKIPNVKVSGPASSTDSNLAGMDGTTGKKIKDSGLSIADTSSAISLKHAAASDDNFHGLSAVTSFASTDELLAYISSAYKKITVDTLMSMVCKDSVYFNLDYNSQMEVMQVPAYATPNDDVYDGPDGVNILSETNGAVTPSQETTVVPAGCPTALKLTWITANKKAGFARYYRSVDSKKYRGKTASLQVKLGTATGHVIRHARVGFCAWTDTADTLTSDLVNAWGNEGTNPTLATSWAFLNTPADLVPTLDGYLTARIENVSVPANTNNLAVFVWVDDTDAAAGDILYCTEIKINEGPICTPFSPRSYENELQRCLWEYEQTYDIGTAPGTATSAGVIAAVAAAAIVGYAIPWNFRVTKPSIGQLYVYSRQTGTVSKAYDYTTTSDVDCLPENCVVGTRSALLSISSTDQHQYGIHAVIDCRL